MSRNNSTLDPLDEISKLKAYTNIALPEVGLQEIKPIKLIQPKPKTDIIKKNMESISSYSRSEVKLKPRKTALIIKIPKSRKASRVALDLKANYLKSTKQIQNNAEGKKKEK